jgi:hypothetical protein
MNHDVSKQLNKLLLDISGGYEVRPFVSDKNTNVSSVQFVIRTGTIEMPKEDNAVGIQRRTYLPGPVYYPVRDRLSRRIRSFNEHRAF